MPTGHPSSWDEYERGASPGHSDSASSPGNHSIRFEEQPLLDDSHENGDDGGDGEEVAEGLHGFRGRAGCAREGVCGVRGAGCGGGVRGGRDKGRRGVAGFKYRWERLEEARPWERGPVGTAVAIHRASEAGAPASRPMRRARRCTCRPGASRVP